MSEQSPDSGTGGDRELYHGYSVDDEDQAQSTGDSLVVDRGQANSLDEGYSPPEKYSAGQGWGNTPLEESLGETMDRRLGQEEPEADPYEEAEAMSIDQLEGTADADRDQVGDRRAGRLVAPDEGAHTDTEGDLIGTDVGIDGAAASAEEAAVHVIE